MNFDYWRTTPWDRRQHVLIGATLDEMIEPDANVRIFEDLLKSFDWTEWEAEYPRRRGQPPYHPRVIATLILYCLTDAIYSSRDIEEACTKRLDVAWLMNGAKPDHSSICKFRRKFRKKLVHLFRKICRLGQAVGLVRLNRIGLDGTAIRANSSRHRTLTKKRIEEQLAQLEEQFGQMLDQAEKADAEDKDLFGESKHEIPVELRDAKQRKERLKKAMDTIEQLDQAKKKEGGKSKSQLPATDPDSRVLPNKDGGFAPNYTGMVAADDAAGFIVDASVLPHNVESAETIASLDRVTETFGKAPECLLADSHHALGKNLAEMEKRETEFYSPVASSEPQPGDVAYREDPTVAVPQSEWERLPVKGKKHKQLDKSAFVYVSKEDAYYCPQGRRLTYSFTETNVRSGEPVKSRRYSSDNCEGCGLFLLCVSRGGKRRTLRRDEYAELREAQAKKMALPESEETYAYRMHLAETPFAAIKGNLGIRQFQTRGQENVTGEWYWICIALNLKKLVQWIGAVRALAAAAG